MSLMMQTTHVVWWQDHWYGHRAASGGTASCLPSQSHPTITVTHVTAASCWAMPALSGVPCLVSLTDRHQSHQHFLSRLIIQSWRQQHCATRSSCSPVLCSTQYLHLQVSLFPAVLGPGVSIYPSILLLSPNLQPAGDRRCNHHK